MATASASRGTPRLRSMNPPVERRRAERVTK
jgi:hypothetical protein